MFFNNNLLYNFLYKIREAGITVPAMEEAVRLIKEKAPFCKTLVGGAVLTKEYSEKIGADKYAKDAMEAVRYAE